MSIHLDEYRAIYAGTVCACGEYFEAHGVECGKASNVAFQAHAKDCRVHQEFAALPKMQIGEPIQKKL